jgi:UDP-N-acetylmuramate--alanine ligase
VGHEAANLPEGAEVVVSTAIGEDNPELALARERGVEPIHRGALLAELCAEKRLIAIAGAHGKTTTSAMTVWALRELGKDPAFFIGGEVPGLGPNGEAVNAGWGEGEWVVAEADESDGSFLRLDPEVAVVTNVEMDHHSHWGTLDELIAAFDGFLRKAKRVVLPSEAKAPKQHPSYMTATEIFYGKWQYTPGRVPFDEHDPGPETLELAVPGAHNILNARAALAALVAGGIDPDRAGEALCNFRGVRRRLELKGSRGPTRIYDDYAHHPTEVKAALSALRELDPTRLIAVFQPHLYSRTQAFTARFGAALALADEVVVLDVYPAREQPVGHLAGVSGLQVAQAAAERMGGRPVWWLPEIDTAQRALADLLDRSEGTGAVLVTIGAGDVFRLGEDLVTEPGVAAP